MWSLLVIGIAHVYFEWRNDAKNGVKSPTVENFFSNKCLILALADIEEHNQSDIGNEEMTIDTPNLSIDPS